MKRCPGCGYANPGAPAACAVCGADLSPVPPRPDVKTPGKRPGLLVSAGLLLMLLGAYQYFHRAPAPAVRAPAPAERDDYSGVLASLEKMSSLKFLPDGDKLAALSFLYSPEDKVGHAAAGAAGAWLRSGAAGETEGRLFSGLLEAAAAARPPVRRKAAIEAGLAVAFGFKPGAYSARLAEVAEGLASEADPELLGAGFFLSSMAGSHALAGKMRAIISSGRPEGAVLPAACALSRLNDPEGNARLGELASGPCSALRSGALGCLGYSASPRAESLLKEAAAEPGSTACADSAKMALILRGQLAIIKK